MSEFLSTTFKQGLVRRTFLAYVWKFKNCWHPRNLRTQWIRLTLYYVVILLLQFIFIIPVQYTRLKMLVLFLEKIIKTCCVQLLLSSWLIHMMSYVSRTPKHSVLINNLSQYYSKFCNGLWNYNSYIDLLYREIYTFC